MGWGYCLRYLPWAIPGPRHLDHGSAIHGSTALRRHSSNTPIPCLRDLQIRTLYTRKLLIYYFLFVATENYIELLSIRTNPFSEV